MTGTSSRVIDGNAPAALEASGTLALILGMGEVRIIRTEQVKTDVHRVVVDGDRPAALVVKRVGTQVARRLEAVDRWLRGAGLDHIGCPVLGAASADAETVWLVMPDLGGQTLQTRPAVRAQVKSTLAATAALHRRFARHEELAECRATAGDLGVRFCVASVVESIHALEELVRARVADDRVVRLLGRLERLHAELPQRTAVLEEHGGPATLLHGDLWPSNALVGAGARGDETRLIDWDHCGVGPPAYDVSAFLLRFPRTDRRWILAAYERATRGGPWPDAPDAVKNAMWDTIERARLANCAIWAAHAARGEHAEWSLERLADIDSWLTNLEPILPAA